MFAPATNPAGFQAIDSLAQFAARLGAAVGGALEANRVYRRLSRLSNAQLAARGLNHEDIGRMTLQVLINATSE